MKVDGVEVWESTHPADVFTVYRVAFTATADTGVLRFENDSPGGDRSIFIGKWHIIHPQQLQRLLSPEAFVLRRDRLWLMDR